MKRFNLAAFCIVAAGLPGLAQPGLAQPVPPQTPKSSLADLIESGNRKAALDKIRSGADVNQAQPDGTTPVHWAVYKVDYELLQALIDKKAKVSAANQFGATPLAQAAQLADARLVKMLLDAGAEPEGANQDGETALMLAIKTGELPIVQMLLDKGAKVNAVEKFHNQTPLMWAAAANKNAAEMVRLLLAKGADVRPRTLYTDWDSQISSEPRVQYRPVGGLTALLYAVRDGCYACAEELIAAGTNPNYPTPEGVTPLMLAIDNDHNDVAKLLLDKGGNPAVWDWWGRTALYIAVDRKEAGAGGGRGGRGAGGSTAARAASMEIINRLLDAGVDVNAQMNLHRPSRGGNSGRFGEEQHNTGTTPLFRAAEGNDVELMQALLAKGANPNINAMGFTPFLLAAGVSPGGRGGGTPNPAVLDLMIQHGADVNAQVTGTRTYSMRISYHPPPDQEGASALHEAVRAGRTELVRYLLDRGADPNLADANGKKPIDLLNSTGGGRGTGNGAATGGRGGPGPVSATAVSEIRTLLENAVSKK